MSGSVEHSDTDYQEVNIGPKTFVIPHEWGVSKLSDFSEVEYGKATPDSNGKFPAVGSSGIYDTVGDALTSEETIVVGRKGSAGEAYLLKQPCWPSDTAFYLSNINRAVVDIDFLYYYMQIHSLSEEIEQTTLPSLDRNRLETYQVITPPLQEQREIVDVLETLDDKIRQTDTIIENINDLRSGLLQDLFHHGYYKHGNVLAAEEFDEHSGGVNTGLDQTTIGEIPASWSMDRLGNLAESSSYGLNASAEEFDESKLRYLRITDIADDGHLKDDDPTSISHKEAEGYELEPGDLMFARTGATVGKTFLYRDEHPDAAYAGYLIRFKLDASRVLPEFVFYYTQTDNYDRWVSRITRQGAQENINTGEYASILLPIPPISEQQEIVDVLQTVDAQIRDEREYKQKLQELKRGLMQDLLTGKVRVEPDETK